MQRRTLSYVLGVVLALPGSAFALSYTCPHLQQRFANTAAAGTTTGTIQSFTIPAYVSLVTIDAAGAQGGAGNSAAISGGLGAEVTTTVSVTAGQNLCVVVGVQGAPLSGGGGSFVYAAPSTSPCDSYLGSVTTGAVPTLLVAAGGGGGGADTVGLYGVAPSGAGTAGASAGKAGDQGGAGAGGTGGNGGRAGTGYSAGGGGLSTDGASYGFSVGGSALIHGANGGADNGGGGANGGFGGGGSAGGGGGYNGGGGGGYNGLTSTFGGDGGGGSYSIAAPVAANTQSGVQTGNGSVTICYSDTIFANGFE